MRAHEREKAQARLSLKWEAEDRRHKQHQQDLELEEGRRRKEALITLTVKRTERKRSLEELKRL